MFEAIDSLKKMLASLKTSVEAGQPVVAHEPLARLLDKLKAAAEGRLAVSPPAVAQAQETDKKLDTILEDPAEFSEADRRDLDRARGGRQDQGQHDPAGQPGQPGRANW